MTFSDIFKSSFLSNVTAVSMFDMVIALVLAFLNDILYIVRLRYLTTNLLENLASLLSFCHSYCIFALEDSSSDIKRKVMGKLYFTLTSWPFCLPGIQFGIRDRTRITSASSRG